jgi:hypothetical protein
VDTKWIYLLKMETELGEEYYKIGITKKDPKKRVKQLQTGNAFDIELIYQFKTEIGNLTETTLHRNYSVNHKRGEWFELSYEQVEGFLSVCETVESNLQLMRDENSYWQDRYNK